MSSPRILAFAGSSRRGSLNVRLLEVAAARARELGAEVTVADLRSLDLPLYDGDAEAEGGLPDGARRWKELLGAHDGLLLACPEYNGSLTPLLKNAIDWASRPLPGEAPLAAFRGKVAALVAASPGALGGLRGLVVVRALLGNIGVHVVPEQFALGTAHQAFDEAGKLTAARAPERVDAVVRQLVETTRRLHA